jgi:hypothetical protein
MEINGGNIVETQYLIETVKGTTTQHLADRKSQTRNTEKSDRRGQVESEKGKVDKMDS